jgi:hypothetical protein
MAKHPISRKDANKEISRHLKMQESIQASKMFEKFPKSVQKFFASKRISFAFYKEELDTLFNSVSDANGLRIYLAMNKNNSRSIVITACKITLGSVIIENRLPAPPDDGGNQYPFVVPTKQDGDGFDLGDE